MSTGTKLKVVIIGGGFGGLAAAKALRSNRVQVTLIDRTNHHVFQPLLYQVATAALSAADVAQPIRSVLRGRENVHVIMDTVEHIDTNSSTVIGQNGIYQYDRLIVAPGSRHSYFAHSEWEQYAPGLKTLEDALDIRTRLLMTFEEADQIVELQQLPHKLTFVIVGGGPTGVEMAGAIAEISARTMLPDFPRISRDDIRVILVEASPRLLAAFHPDLSERALDQLTALGVEVLLNTRVVSVSSSHLDVEGNGTTQSITTHNIIWAAGNSASALLTDLQTPLDRLGRAIVQPNLTLPGNPHVYVIGDAAHFEVAGGTTLPGVAQTAMQMGAFAAESILLETQGKRTSSRVFRYRDKGSMATIGRARAIMQIGRLRASGFIAWFAWAAIHIMALISFRNRLKVLIEWMWFYVSFQPGARILHRIQEQTRTTPHPSEHELHS